MKREKDYKNWEIEQDEKEQKKKKRNRRIRNIIIIVGIVIILFFLLRSCNSGIKLPEEVEKVVDVIWDSGQKNKEDVETETSEERQERINREAMKGMLTIDLNVTPVFENGKAEGNFQFLNDKDNFYLMQVEVYREDTNELIYKSGLIEQGNIIEKAKLNVPLPKGVYDCTTYFNAVDPETYTVKGTVGSKMKITILN